MKRDFSTSHAVHLISQQEKLNRRTWWSMSVAICKTANARWDCAKSVLFFIVSQMMGCSTKAQRFLSKFWHLLDPLMASIFKWKGRWHWQFPPAAMKIYPTATPTLWCVVILWLSSNVQLSTGYILCIFSFWEQCFISSLNGSAVVWVSIYSVFLLVNIKKQRGEMRKGDRKHTTDELKHWKDITLETNSPHSLLRDVNQNVTPPCVGLCQRLHTFDRVF